MKPKFKYNKMVNWTAREIFKELAKNIDEDGHLDPDIGKEIKEYVKAVKA
jgi:hypothetical protein